MNKSKKSSFILILSIIFLIFVLFLKICFPKNNTQPFGITVLKVSSNSMIPVFEKNDAIIVKKQENYEVGDIVTYRSEENCLITHRIIEKYENVFITKGDHNNVEDEEKVKPEDIVGKVIYIFK